MTKLYTYFLKEARKDKNWAKKVLRDKKWVKKASTASMDMARQYAEQPIERMAIYRMNYLKHRATAKGDNWGSEMWIDKTAREKYKRIVGRYPPGKLKV